MEPTATPSRARGPARPVTWLCSLLALVFALLMLYVPYHFEAEAYRLIYPYLRLYGAAFFAAWVLMVGWAAGMGLPRPAGLAGHWLLAGGLLGLMVLVAMPFDLHSHQVTFGLLVVAACTAPLVPERQPAMARHLYTLLPLAAGALRVALPELPGYPLYAAMPLGLGWLFLSTGVLHAAAPLLVRRRPAAAWAGTLLVAVPFGWHALAWVAERNWTGAGLNATLSAGAAAWALYQRRPWRVRISGLRRRILAMTLAASLLPLIVMGAVGVYAMEQTDRAAELDYVQLGARQVEREVQALLAGRPDAAQDPAGLGQMLGGVLADPSLEVRVLDPSAVPGRWGPESAGALVDLAPGGERQVVAFVRRPDLGLALAVVQPYGPAFEHAERAAAAILLATVLAAAVAAAAGLVLSGQVTRRLGEVREVAAAVAAQRFAARVGTGADSGDEVALLAVTINNMAQALEAYTEELRAQDEELQVQAEQIQAQNEELQAQAEELAAQAEELTCQAEALREAQQELEDSLALLDNLLTIAPVGFAFLDRDLRYARVNAALAECNGVSVEAHVGRTVREVVPGLADAVEPVFRRIMETDEPISNWELTGETPAAPGVTRHWLESIYPVRRPDGALLGVSAVVVEVTAEKRLEAALRRSTEELEVKVQERTAELVAANRALQEQVAERQRAEQALAERERLLRAIFNQTFQFVGLLRPDGTVMEVNQTALDFGGLSRADVVGRPFWTAGWWQIHPQAQERLQAAIARAAAGEFVRYEAEVAGAGGRVAVIDFSLKPLGSAGHQPTLLIAEGRDMTEIRRAQAVLREREAAMEREQARSRFLQIAAHELRNPMASVKGILSLLKRRLASGRPVGDLVQQTAIMEREVDRLSALLDEILEAFRAQEGQLALRKEELDLARVLQSALEPFLAVQGSHRFRVEGVHPGSTRVRGDFRRLEEVFRNLLSNAVKYSPDGGDVTVRLQAEGGWARVEVSDTGIGIPADQLEKVFAGFFRASNLWGRDPGGLGLGLYICREVVQRHGGRIWAESDERAGSTFSVALPLAGGPAGPEQA